MSTDEELYRQARQGEMAAFDQLYARYERRLFSFVLRYVGDRARAEEVFHDTFVRVLTGRQAEFGQARFVAWLFRVARNLCANLLRGEARSSRAVEKLEWESTPVSSPEERLENEERATSLAKALARLPATLADVFALRSSGLSYHEIADALEIPLGTVKSRMNALVHQLRGELES